MKKIVSAALVASMVAGAAFAEVKISNNFRIRPVLAEWNMGTEAPTLSRYFDLDGVQGASDTLSFEAKTDYAGVKNVINTDLTKKSWDSTDSSDTSKQKTYFGRYSIDTFNGYLKFGNLTFTGGYFDSRIANRVTTDQNNLSFIEQNWGATYNTAKKSGNVYTTEKTNNKIQGAKKLGVNANISPTLGVDSDNITAIEGTKALSFVADYVFADLGGGNLQLWAALNKSTDAWPTTNGDGVKTVEVDSVYAFRAAYTADAFAANATMKVARSQIVAAAFFSPKMVDGLVATLGFTFANNGQNKDADDKAQQYFAIDARARYAINDAAAAGIYLNYTNVAKYNNVDAYGVLDTVVNFNYKLNDIVKLFVEGEFVFNTNSDMRKTTGSQLAAQVGGLFTAGKGAEIDVAARLAKGGIGYDTDTTGGKNTKGGMQISIPVVMRVKL